MHGAAPLVRTAVVVAAPQQTASRIPHLNHHIVQRRLASPARCIRSPASRIQRRYQTTTIGAGLFREDATQVEQEDVQQRVRRGGLLGRAITRNVADQPKTAAANDDAVPTRATNQQMAGENIYTILEEGNPDKVFFALLDEVLGTPFIKYAPDELFDKAFLTLDHEHFVEPFKDTYRFIEHQPGHKALSKGIRDCEERFEMYATRLAEIVAARRDAGNQLSPDVCRHTLQWASSMGNAELASGIMNDIMTQDEVKPDITSFNHYMHAKIWSKGYSRVERFKHRVLPRHLELRGSNNPPIGMSGYKVANARKGHAGIRQEVLDIFQQLMRQDLTADEYTFVNMITAMGREGDMAGVKSILKSVWNIDVDLLLQYDEDEIESPTFYEKDSPLRPSNRLMFAIAHTFGTNNDARTAWLLIDYISRNYDVQISNEVWTQLLEWYMVLGITRTPAEKKQGRDVGHIKPEVFEQLFLTMTDAPHFVKPSGPQSYLRARSARERRHLDSTIQACHSLRKSLHEQRETVDYWVRKLTNSLTSAARIPNFSIWTDRQILSHRHNFIVASLKFEALNQLTKRVLVQDLFGERRWAGTGGEKEWERRGIPTLIGELVESLPNYLEYKTRDGLVRIELAEHRAEYNRKTYRMQYSRMCFLRFLLDTDDHGKLESRLRWLSKRVVQDDAFLRRAQREFAAEEQVFLDEESVLITYT